MYVPKGPGPHHTVCKMPNDAPLKPAYRLVLPSPLGRVTNNGPCGTIKGKTTELELCTTFRGLLVNPSGAKHTCSRIWALTEPGEGKTEGRRDVNACVAGCDEETVPQHGASSNTLRQSTVLKQPHSQHVFGSMRVGRTRWCHKIRGSGKIAPSVAPGK